MGPSPTRPPLPHVALPTPRVDPPVAHEADLTCPLCGYDLRGLTEHRCPECGHAFDPAELRAKAERREWFFEHARRRLVGSFVVTSFISLHPIAFWGRVHAAHQIEPRRLTLWWAAWIALAIAVLLTLFGHAVYAERQGAAAVRSVISSTAVRSYRASNGRLVPLATRTPAVAAIVPAIDWSDAIDRAIARRAFVPSAKVVIAAIAWPSIAALAMGVFAHTLRKAGVSRGHVRRCTHYALPLTLLPVFAIVLASAALGWELQRVPALADFWYLRVFRLSDVASIALVAAIVGSTLHLVTSHVRYLRLPQAALTALLAQTVAWLAIAVALFFVGTIV